MEMNQNQIFPANLDIFFVQVIKLKHKNKHFIVVVISKCFIVSCYLFAVN